MVEFFHKKNVFLIAILIFVAVFIGIISAGFQVGEDGESYFIEKIYGPEFDVIGWVNISFTDESIESMFEDDFGNSITLEKILEVNPSYVHSCDPLGCGEDYSPSNGETTKAFNINSGNTYLAGFVLTGNIKSINNITFDVESDGSENSCISPLKIDILDDGIIEKGYIHGEGPYIEEMNNFLEIIQNQTKQAYTFEEDLQILKILESIEKSSDEGKREFIK